MSTFFTKLAMTFMLLGIAVLVILLIVGSDYPADMLDRKLEVVMYLFGGLIGFSLLLAGIAAIWEGPDDR